MQLGWTIVYVENVRETVAFYQKCFGLTQRSEEYDGQFAEMETGSTRLAFTSEALIGDLIPRYHQNRAGSLPGGFEIVFVTDDVAAAYAKALAGGAVSVVAPDVMPWGQTVAYVRDLNGVLVELATPLP